MISSRELYKTFLLKLNRNDSNTGINVLPSLFVLIFNAERLKWQDDRFGKDSDSWDIDELSELFITDVNLTKVKDTEDSSVFKLPEDFARVASSYSIASRGPCKTLRIFNYPKKTIGLQAIQSDDFNGPQFDYEETPYVITQDNIKIFRDDFEIKKAVINYYKIPKAIDISGYVKLDGSNSVDQDSDLSNRNAEQVIDRVVLEVKRNYKDAEGFQFAKERVQTEK